MPGLVLLAKKKKKNLQALVTSGPVNYQDKISGFVDVERFKWVAYTAANKTGGHSKNLKKGRAIKVKWSRKNVQTAMSGHIS